MKIYYEPLLIRNLTLIKGNRKRKREKLKMLRSRINFFPETFPDLSHPIGCIALFLDLLAFGA